MGDTKESSMVVEPDEISIRPVTLNDLEHAGKIASVVNRAFRSDESWISDYNLISGDRITAQQIEHDIRRQQGGKQLLPAILCAFIDNKSKEKEANNTATTSDDTIIVGVVRIDEYDYNREECLIDMLSVLPQYQTQGLGSRLGFAAMMYVKALGYTKVAIEVFHTKEPLLAWYRKCGFSDTGTVELRVPPEAVISKGLVTRVLRVNLKREWIWSLL